MSDRTCSVEGCAEVHFAKGKCVRCYRRSRKIRKLVRFDRCSARNCCNFFATSRSTMTYCSTKCRARENARRLAQHAPSHVEGECLTLRCIHCRDPFEIVARRGGLPGYCSDECRKAEARRRGREGGYRRNDLKRHYGLTEEQLEAMLQSQGGKCAICRKSKPGGKTGKWVIDHDHGFGHVRGLLCSNCNVGLGMFSDSEQSLWAAAKYLRAAQPQLRLIG